MRILAVADVECPALWDYFVRGRLDEYDLILSCGSSPSLRLNGALVAHDSPALTAFDTQRLLFSLLTDHQRE